MNPTHYAVALKYEKGMGRRSASPRAWIRLRCAFAILRGRTVSPSSRNPPLARALHAKVAIDEEIPVEHYKAVAEVIGYVLRLKRRAS